MYTYIYICVNLEIYLYKYISIYLLTYFSSCIVPPSFIQKRWIPKQKIHPFFDLKDLQPSLRSGFPCFDPNPANAAAPCEGRCVPLELGMFLRLEVGRGGKGPG